MLTVEPAGGEAGFRKSSSARSVLDMASASFALSVSPVAENTTITLGRGSDRLSWMNRLTLVVAAGSGLNDRAKRSLPEPSELFEPLEPFCCMRAAGHEPQRAIRANNNKAGAVGRETAASGNTPHYAAQGGSSYFPLSVL